MQDWLTYRLSDFLLFSAHTYYRLFELYHRDIWPAQVISLFAVVVVVVALVRSVRYRDPIVLCALAAAWLWVGIAFHMRRYLSINWAATYFGALFVAQAALLLAAAVQRVRGRDAWFVSLADGRRAAAAFLIAVALPPIVGLLTERSWQQVELFGLTPDATAVATVAVLVFRQGGWRRLLVAPLISCAISVATLWALGSREAWLSIAAVVVAFSSLIRRRTQPV